MIVPTARTAWIAALFAPVALIVAASTPGAWTVAPAAALVLVLLVLLDGAMAGRLIEWRVVAPADSEVGEPLVVRVLVDLAGRVPGGSIEATLAFDPRLDPSGRTAMALGPADGAWQGEATVRPVRRGTAPLERVWLRWSGPLGLGARLATHSLDQAVRIWPDLSPVRSPALQHFMRDASLGTVARRIRGEGTQFEALSEYQPGMDRRRIDWKSSARHSRLYARENEAERNNQIVFAFDCGQAMCEPVEGLPRIDRAVSAALTAAWVAIKGGDRVSLFGFARRPEVMTPFYGETRAFHRLQSAAAALDYRAEEPNFTLALATLAARLRRRSMIVLFSEFSDPTSAELMVESLGRLVDKHLVLFVTVEDSELAAIQREEPATIDALATAVAADTLARQRALVLQRLRQLGIDVIEAPWDAIGYRLIDRYLDAKRKGAIA
ncbi:hypothetical protein A6F68_01184 [Tsuneonella dongtanensis]|uniref:DUF58 domain-containing protein n=1 Tax=Tsuneonella dongtanensis TaxID=692370 RepID=A0A1B2AC14_9SPHN|nr:DUF58 domain-containing protein [Tsuneonella dongtanensis]ANY19702.1 hypothetical protein A6F68_01184 [Tsuneonella dongtanensis]